MNAVKKLTLAVGFDNEFPLDYQNLTAISHITKQVLRQNCVDVV